jgi:oligoribonuclease (3'-5' exoribonuclease)
MKYVSIDIETTGLNPHKDQILMVAMIVEDTENKLPREESPTFACFCAQGIEGAEERYEGSPYALWLNAWIFEALAKNDESKYPIYHYWVPHALDFLEEHFPDQKVVPAGKNVGSFDLQFFPTVLRKKFIHRSIDPGSVFIDWKSDKPGSLDDIKRRLDIKGEVTHDAVDDAWDVIEVLRTRY